MKEQIQQLQNQIKADKQKIKQLKQQNKTNHPFAATRFGKFYFQTLQTVAVPFVALHDYTVEQKLRANTAMWQQNVLVAQGLLAEAGSMDDHSDDVMANKLAKVSMDLKSSDFHDVDGLLEQLDKEIARLRNESPALSQTIQDLIDEQVKRHGS